MTNVDKAIAAAFWKPQIHSNPVLIIDSIKATLRAHGCVVIPVEWLPIETAPTGVSVLITNGSEQRVAYHEHDAEPYPWHVEDAANGFNHYRDWPTHWRPLLEPPAGGQ